MLKVTLLLISFMGYFAAMHVFFEGKKTALYPTLLTSLVVTAGFFGGLTGQMQRVFGFLYISGFVLLVLFFIYMRRKGNLVPRLTVTAAFPFVVLIAGTYFLYIFLQDRFLFSYDDFTHWGRVARLYSTEFRFPVDADLLSHASYPPGSALFIGYVSHAVGSSAGTWYFAQGLMLLSLWIALLAAGKNVFVQMILCLPLAFLMEYNSTLESLNTDNLLAAASFACIVVCMSEEFGRQKVPFALPLALCTLVLIKNSGLFLALLIGIYSAVLYWRRCKRLSIHMMTLFLPFVLLLLWNGYIDQHITQSMAHQVSADYYQKILNGKTADDLRIIWRTIWPMMSDPRNNHAMIIAAGFAVAAVVCRKRKAPEYCQQATLFAVVMFVIYEVGILLMYVFSMPMSEILFQQGKDYIRYNNTMTATLAALALYLTFDVLAPNWGRMFAWRTLLTCAAAAIITGAVIHVAALHTHSLRSVEYRQETKKTAYSFSLLEERLKEIPAGESYVVLFGEPDSANYHRYMSRYYLRSKDVLYLYDADFASEQMKRDGWRYFIDLTTGVVYEPTETVAKELYTRTLSDTYTNLLDTIGYKENARYSTSNACDIAASYWDMTGYIPAKIGDTLYLKNIVWYPSKENDARCGIYRFMEDKSFRWNSYSILTDEDLLIWNPVFDEAGNIIQITIPAEYGTSTVYLRIICQDINNTSIITVNEPIQ